MKHQRMVILGAGTGGTLAANRLRKKYSTAELEIDIVDQDNQHVYQPGLLFVPFGLTEPDDIVRKRDRQLHKGINYHESEIESVDIEANEVHLGNGTTLDVRRVVDRRPAPCCCPRRPRVWRAQVGSRTCSRSTTCPAPRRWPSGSRPSTPAIWSINVVDMPIKCPVAPLEFAFLADWYFTDEGVRDDVTITYVTPLDGAFTKPIASADVWSPARGEGHRASSPSSTPVRSTARPAS